MAQQTYTVKAGDTGSAIASQYGVNLSDISGYKSGDINKIGVGEVLTINTRDQAPANTINATNLGQNQYAVPPVTPVTGYDGLIKSSEAAITTLTPEVDKGKADIEGKYQRLGQLPSERAAGYEAEGVYTKQQAYNNLVNTINQKELAYQTQVDKIRNNNPTGQLESGQQIQIDKLTKDWAITKAALSISAAFAKDDYTTAKSIVDDRIDAETEGLRNELEGMQYFYSQNYNELSDERKNLLEFQIQQVADEKAAKEDMLKEIGAVQLEAAANGAPSDVIVSIGKSGDLTSAITAAGSYIGLLDRQREARLAAGDSGGSGSVAITAEDKRALTGAGFSTQDIADLQQGIAEFGIQAVLDSIEDPAKKAAVRKVYNVADAVTREQIEATTTQKMAQDALKKAYTTDELKQIARDNGFASFWKSKSKEMSNFLNSPEAKNYYVNQLVDQYKAAGMFQE